MAFTQITVTGNYQLGDGTVPTGEVRFTPTAVMRNEASGSTEVAVTEPVTATLDANGALSITLAATDDPDTTPTGVQYLVEELFHLDSLGRINRYLPSRSFVMPVPYNGGAIDLTAVNPDPRASAALGALSATAAGSRVVSGVAAASLGAVTAGGRGTVFGTASAALGQLTASMADGDNITGQASAPLGALTATATGVRTVTGVAAATLGALTSTAAGTVTRLGTAAAALGALTATSTGAVENPNMVDDLSVPFTDSNDLTGEYHVFAAGLPGDGTTGLVVHFHGDDAYEHLNPTLNYGIAGNRGLAEVANRKGYVFVSALAPDVTGTVTWWEDGVANTDYFADLLQHLIDTYGIDTDHIWLSGYSGGAVFITEWFVPEYGTAMLEGASCGAVIVGGGDVPATGEGATNNGFSSTLKANFEMHWLTGAQDDGTFSDDSYDALAAATAGRAYYSGQGFATAELTSPLGHGHELDGAFGPILDDYLPALSGYDVDTSIGSTRPTLIASQLKTGTGTTTLTATSFTPSAGEVILLKVFNADLDSPNIGEITPDSLTWATIQHIQDTGFAECWIFTAVVPAGGVGTIAPAVTFFGTSGAHGMVVERWQNAQVRGRQVSGPSPTHSTGAPSATVTTTTDHSVLSWICADWDVTAGTATYRSSAVQTQTFSNANIRAYAAYQNPTSAASQTIGLSAPAGQTWTMAVVELLPAPD